jgi:hypothetical protein
MKGYDRCQGSLRTMPMCLKVKPPSVLIAAPISPLLLIRDLASYSMYTVYHKGEGKQLLRTFLAIPGKNVEDGFRLTLPSSLGQMKGSATKEQ